MQTALKIESLRKTFSSSTALAGINLRVKKGSVFGFVGPNGAGKTTTIRIMLDLLHADAGRVLFFGKDPRRDGAVVRESLGYLPGELRLDERLTAEKLLTYLARLRGLGSASYLELAERFSLPMDKKIAELSTGTKQKVGIVQAFAHNPRIVVLDEPTSGLDPLLQKTFQELLLERVEQGLTAFISSHILSELEEVAEEVAFIHKGLILEQTSIDEIKSRALHRVTIHFKKRIRKDFFKQLPGASEIKVQGTEASLLLQGSMEGFFRLLEGREVLSLTSEEPDLEELFLQIYGEGV